MVEKKTNLPFQCLPNNAGSSNSEVIYPFVNRLIRQVETILNIDPSLNDKEIFHLVSKSIVEFFSAEFANIWIFDHGWRCLTSSGQPVSLPEGDKSAMTFDASIAEEVIRTCKSYSISNILKEDRWKDKEALVKSGIYSLLFVPLVIHQFSSKYSDFLGIFQILYKDQDKTFTPLEFEVAEMLARRVSYVLAQKRIRGLYKYNAIKDKVAEQIFLRLAQGEGIKMVDLFNSAIPALSEIIQIQRCALFSIQRDRREILLEAGYPPRNTESEKSVPWTNPT